MWKKVLAYFIRTLIVLAAVASVAGVAYWLVPSTSAAPLGERGRGNALPNAAGVTRQGPNRLPTDSAAPRENFEREGGRGFSAARGMAEFMRYLVLLTLVFGAVVLGLEIFRKLPWRVARKTH